MLEMLHKMKRQEYHMPDALGLSEACKALLQQMLQPDPAQRIRMADIMRDAWFLTHLPPNAINMNDGYLAKPRPCAQSEGDIRGIVQEAAKLLG
jgi:serine/threonine-protein kinase SRK2